MSRNLAEPPRMTDKRACRFYRDIGEEYASMRQAYCARSRFLKACAAFHVRLTLYNRQTSVFYVPREANGLPREQICWDVSLLK